MNTRQKQAPKSQEPEDEAEQIFDLHESEFKPKASLVKRKLEESQPKQDEMEEIRKFMKLQAEEIQNLKQREAERESKLTSIVKSLETEREEKQRLALQLANAQNSLQPYVSGDQNFVLKPWEVENASWTFYLTHEGAKVYDNAYVLTWTQSFWLEKVGQDNKYVSRMTIFDPTHRVWSMIFVNFKPDYKTIYSDKIIAPWIVQNRDHDTNRTNYLCCLNLNQEKGFYKPGLKWELLMLGGHILSDDHIIECARGVVEALEDGVQDLKKQEPKFMIIKPRTVIESNQGFPN